jgi:hypothetical protein
MCHVGLSGAFDALLEGHLRKTRSCENFFSKENRRHGIFPDLLAMVISGATRPPAFQSAGATRAASCQSAGPGRPARHGKRAAARSAGR